MEPSAALMIPPLLLVKMLASKSQFALVVKGGIIGLAAATVTILLIWVHELRRGRIW
jgi:hypothetical protein